MLMQAVRQQERISTYNNGIPHGEFILYSSNTPFNDQQHLALFSTPFLCISNIPSIREHTELLLLIDSYLLENPSPTTQLPTMDSRSTYAPSHNSRAHSRHQQSYPKQPRAYIPGHRPSNRDSNPFTTPAPTTNPDKLVSPSIEEPKSLQPPFNSHRRLKLALHCTILPALIPIMVVGAMSMFTRGTPRNRANTFVLSMAAKSLMFIQYELLTSHVRRFKKWASVKAYMVLSCMEVVFWLAAIVLLAMGIIKGCYARGCILSYVAVGASSALL